MCFKGVLFWFNLKTKVARGHALSSRGKSTTLLDVIDLQGLDPCLVVLPLIVKDCWKLQHYCLDIIGNFRFGFINCND